MRSIHVVCALVGFLFLTATDAADGPATAAAAAAATAVPASAPAGPPRQLSIKVKPWQGDFDAMLERRVIRVLVPYSRTLYFNDKGHERGLAAELVRDFERYVNKTYADRLGKRPLTIILLPTTPERLLPDHLVP